MESSDTLPIALIGAGRIAETWARVLAEHPGVKVRAVADPRREAALTLAERLDCEAAVDAFEVLESRGLGAILICTPPATHAALAHVAIRAGAAVLCEKPLALGVDQARGLLEAARAAGGVLAMASKYRFIDDVVRARELIASGLLGELVWLDNAFTSREAMAGRWHSDATVSGGGVLIDNGVHSFDLIRFVAGPITAVQAQAGPRIQALEVEDSVRLWLRTACGAMASVDLSWSLDRHAETFLEAQGSEGCLQVGWHGSRYRLASDDAWTRFGHGYDKLAAFRGQLDDFLASIQGQGLPRTEPADALASMRVVERAYASLRSGTWVEVEPEAGG